MDSIFKLPLELRQSIYDLLLPRDRMVTSDLTCWQEEEAIEALGKVNRQVRAELGDWVIRTCGLRIVLSDSLSPSYSMPSIQRIRKVKRFELYFDHYDIRGDFSLVRLQRRTRQLVATINGAACRIERLVVRFQEELDEYASTEVDEHWCEYGTAEIQGDGRNDFESRHDLDRILLRKNDDDGSPVVDYLLRPLLELPVCDQVYIERIYQLRWARVWEYDFLYMCRLCDSMEAWLEGEREAGFESCRQILRNFRPLFFLEEA